MLKAISVVIVFVSVVSCSATSQPQGQQQDSCREAVAKADQLLQLAEDSLQLSAKQITAVSAHNLDSMIQINDQLHEISKQTDTVGPEYQALRAQCIAIGA